MAERLNVPLTQIYSVATFYTMFSLVPKGAISSGSAWEPPATSGAASAWWSRWPRRLGSKVGQTTEDLLFSLETVGCLGLLRPGPGDDDRRQIFCPHDGGARSRRS